MSNLQIEQIQKYFGMKNNKERLLKLLKTDGEFLEFREKVGFIYAVKIGEAEGMEVMLKIAMLAGNFTIQYAYKRAKVIQEEIA